MNVETTNQCYVLALFPSTRGMAFALFDSPLSLVDWGHVSIKGDSRNLKCTDAAKRLIERYVPDVVVLEDTSKRIHSRGARIAALNQAFVTLAVLQGVEVLRLPSKEIRQRFEAVGARTKEERAKMIANMLPALSHKLPPKRKAWMSEDPRMALFEAAALALGYYGREQMDTTE